MANAVVLMVYQLKFIRHTLAKLQSFCFNCIIMFSEIESNISQPGVNYIFIRESWERFEVFGKLEALSLLNTD